MNGRPETSLMIRVPPELNTAEKVATPALARAAGIAFGIGTQCLFAFTIWRLFSFLSGSMGAVAPRAVVVDILLALQFAIPHSVLLLPQVKQRITRHLPREFYGCLFCVATCVSLWLMFTCWRAMPVLIWDLSGPAAALVRVAFVGAWVGLFTSISHTGLGYQTGWTEWWHWFRRQSLPRRGFATHGAYRWLRHPIYLSFLGLIWFTPRMTLDHALLTGVWTVYVFVGSMLKDWRLTYYIGDDYRKYASRVAGYPGLPWGPLAKWTTPAESAPATPTAPAPARTSPPASRRVAA